jgi:hypothetical protein
MMAIRLNEPDLMQQVVETTRPSHGECIKKIVIPIVITVYFDG